MLAGRKLLRGSLSLILLISWTLNKETKHVITCPLHKTKYVSLNNSTLWIPSNYLTLSVGCEVISWTCPHPMPLSSLLAEFSFFFPRFFSWIKSKHSCLLDLSNYLKIKLYKTIILPVVLYGCKAWSLTLRGESRLRVFENRILRRIFGPTRMGIGEGSTMRNFIVCTVHLIESGRLNLEDWDGPGM